MDKIKSIPSQWKELVNDDQKRAIEHIYGPLLIIAGAGMAAHLPGVFATF